MRHVAVRQENLLLCDGESLELHRRQVCDGCCILSYFQLRLKVNTLLIFYKSFCTLVFLHAIIPVFKCLVKLMTKLVALVQTAVASLFTDFMKTPQPFVIAPN